MNNIKNTFLILLISITIFSCTKEYEVPEELIVHDFVWKGLNAYYLYQEEIENLSDTRFGSDQELNSYLNTFTDYNSLFNSLLRVGDQKSNLVEDYNTILEPELRTSFTNGIEFGIIAQPNHEENVLAYITHILPNSDAANKNILRGTFFYAVNDVQLTRTNYQDLLLNGADNYTLNFANFNGFSVTPNSVNVSLTKSNHTHEAVFLEKTIPNGFDNIGYLMYNNDFSDYYINTLNNTFLNFKNQNVTKLILDFRYNTTGGSFAKNMALLSNMIKEQPLEEATIKEQWNTKAQSWFLANQPDSLVTKFSNRLNETTALNSLNITDVYIVLNGANFNGSSALELLINNLNPLLNVHVVGNETEGNNTGSITLYNSMDYDFGVRNMTHNVALQPIVLSFLNQNDETYTNGFTPTIDLCLQENLLTLGVLGESSDEILNRILNHIETGATGNENGCNSNNFEYLFNSLDAQRQIDKGVFIKQNLPNTL